MLSLGRRVYVGAVVVVATMLRHGITPMRAQRLRGHLVRPVNEQQLPDSLLGRLSGNPGDKNENAPAP